MRIRSPWKPWADTKKVVVQPKKVERLDYVRAEWLRMCTSAYLAPFSYDLERERLEYDVTGTETLKRRLASPLSSEDYIYLLVGMVQAIMACSKAGYKSSDLIFDPERVYVDGEGTPLFLFVPLNGVVLGVENSPLTMLRVLGDTGRLRFKVADDVLHAEHLADFVRREGVWSQNNFLAFMKQEFGIAFDVEGQPVAVVDHESSFKLHTDSQDGGSEHLGDTAENSFGGFGGYGSGKKRRTSEDKGAGRGGGASAVLVREKTGEGYPLRDGVETDVGKGSGAAVQIFGNGMISRSHAHITYSDGYARICDNGSTNGTFVQGRRLQSGEAARVRLGERFMLADERFHIEQG